MIMAMTLISIWLYIAPFTRRCTNHNIISQLVNHDQTFFGDCGLDLWFTWSCFINNLLAKYAVRQYLKSILFQEHIANNAPVVVCISNMVQEHI